MARNDGGINCEIVRSGTIRRGDTVQPISGSLDLDRINTPKVPAVFIRPSERTAEDLAALAEMNAVLAQAQAEVAFTGGGGVAGDAVPDRAEEEEDVSAGDEEEADGGGLFGWVRGLFRGGKAKL
jgi:hypothetical protein